MEPRDSRRAQGPREARHALHGGRDRRARRRPSRRRDQTAHGQAQLPAARSRLRPLPARPDAGALRLHPRHAQRVAASGHHRARRRQALHPPLQLPAVLHRRDGPYGQPQAPRDRTRQPRRARASACNPVRGRVPLRHSRGLRGHGVQRLQLDGLHLWLHARAHGRWRAAQAPRVRHRHGPHPGGGQDRRPVRHPGPRGLPRRHGLQGDRHRARHNRHADGQQGHRPHARDPLRSPAPGARGSRVHPQGHARRHPGATRDAQGHRAADHHHPDSAGQDPRRHRCRRQGHPRHPGRHGRHGRHPGGRLDLHRRNRGRGRGGRRAYQSHRQGARGGRRVHRPRCGHPAVRRVRGAASRQGRPAAHQSRGAGSRRQGRGRALRGRRGSR